MMTTLPSAANNNEYLGKLVRNNLGVAEHSLRHDRGLPVSMVEVRSRALDLAAIMYGSQTAAMTETKPGPQGA